MVRAFSVDFKQRILIAFSVATIFFQLLRLLYFLKWKDIVRQKKKKTNTVETLSGRKRKPTDCKERLRMQEGP